MSAIITTFTKDGNPISVEESKFKDFISIDKSILKQILTYCEENNINEPFVQQLKSLLL